MLSTIAEKAQRYPTLLCVGFLLLLSYFTYVHNFWNPPALFWDENYHIASAQKYLNGTYFMEPHPPLGKLLIAAGEGLLHLNVEDNQFIGTDYATNPPEGFSFTGYRLFPVLLGWLSVPLIFGIFFLITRKHLWALLLSFLYVFDNALIVHSRSAMLESTMIFFSLLVILSYFLLFEWKDDPKKFRNATILFGVAFACALLTKAFALLFVLLVPIAAWQLLHAWNDRKVLFATGAAACLGAPLVYIATIKLLLRIADRGESVAAYNIALFLEHPWHIAFAGLIVLIAAFGWLWTRYSGMRFVLKFLLTGVMSFAVVYIGVWQLHFSLARTVNPALPDSGYYQASAEYKAILDQHKTSAPAAFAYMLRDSLAFVSHYEAGVPPLDLCKMDENGSPWYLWPFGGRTINYRWETPDGNSYRYLYLMSNPVVWGLGLIGLILTVVLLLGSVLYPQGVRIKQPWMLCTFFALYCAFMIAVSRIDRVMYLYHYFLPLIFTFILFALIFMEADAIKNYKLTEERKTSILMGIGIVIFCAFQFFRPLSFYEPLTDRQFSYRNWLRTWELKCVHCESNSPLVIPTK